MKNAKLNAARVWKQYEDLLAPRLGFSAIERVVYSHLLRHSRLEGELRFQFSLSWLSSGVGISRQAVRDAVRRLIARGVLYLVERNCQARHVVRLHLPLEVRAVRAAKSEAVRLAPAPRGVVNIEKADFLRKQNLRRALHSREGGHCFYCLRRITPHRRCLDHVIPHVQGGANSYRSLVSCCVDCNSEKAERPAEQLLRQLFRERKLNSAELRSRFRALCALKAGKLKPPLPRDSGYAAKKDHP